jgi:hypothetical protein
VIGFHFLSEFISRNETRGGGVRSLLQRQDCAKIVIGEAVGIDSAGVAHSADLWTTTFLWNASALTDRFQKQEAELGALSLSNIYVDQNGMHVSQISGLEKLAWHFSPQMLFLFLYAVYLYAVSLCSFAM